MNKFDKNDIAPCHEEIKDELVNFFGMDKSISPKFNIELMRSILTQELHSKFSVIANLTMLNKYLLDGSASITVEIDEDSVGATISMSVSVNEPTYDNPNNRTNYKNSKCIFFMNHSSMSVGFTACQLVLEMIDVISGASMVRTMQGDFI